MSRLPQPTSHVLLNAVILTGAGTQQAMDLKGPITFIADGKTTAGSGASVILVEVSNDEAPGTNSWSTLGTITLTLGTTRTQDLFVTNARYMWVRGNVSSISGTNSAVSLRMVG